jgi:hypothetical protein
LATLRPAFLGGLGTAATIWADWHNEGVELIVIDPSISAKWRLDWIGKDLKYFSRAKFVVLYIQGGSLRRKIHFKQFWWVWLKCRGRGKYIH